MNLLSLTAVELGKKIKAHEVTVEEATRAALDAIRAKEKDINSFVTIDEESAMIRAKEVQKMIDDGKLTGPLAGVPVAIKDNMCTKGMLTTCSSKILYNFIPTYTAEAVINLEKAGAVILGKTNMDEFAMGSTTETSAYGETKNPWNTAHVPGGWKLCGSGSRGMLLCTRIGYRRIYPSAKFILWCDRNQTNLWYRFPLRTDRIRFLSGSDRTDCKGCDRLCHNSGDNYFL